MPTNTIGSIAEEFIVGNSGAPADIITFVESPWGLNTRLLPAQRFILKAYYGLPLEDRNEGISVYDMVNEKLLYKFTEKGFLKYLYEEGRCNTNVTEGKRFYELILAVGRRGSKSSMASFIANYELYKLVRMVDPASHYGFPALTEFHILNVAPADDQAGTIFSMLENMSRRCTYLKDRILHQTMSYFDVQTDNDRKQVGRQKASIICQAGGCSSNSLRGRNAIMVIMDEFAFFIDNGGRFSGSEVYKALTPSTASFKGDGKIVTVSSPYAKYGAFWDRYQQSFEEQENTLSFRMYSTMINHQNLSSDFLKQERRRDRVSFLSEYGGEFSDSVVAWIDDENEFRKCITIPHAPSRGKVDVEYYMGVDLGFKNDGTAVSIVHKEGRTVCLDYADVWYSGSSDVWEVASCPYQNCKKYAGAELIRLADIVEEIRKLHRWFPIKAGIFDQHNGYAMAELMQQTGFTQFIMENFTDLRNNEVFNLVKRMYAEELISLYDHPVLIPELLTLEAEYKVKHKVDVRAPNRKGAHDDLFSAWSRAVWLCCTRTREKQPNAVASMDGVLMGRQMGKQLAPTNVLTFRRNRLAAHGPPQRVPSSLR